MALATNIVKRPGSASYYVRVTVPADLRDQYGKRQIWKSLGTASPSEAKSKAPAILAAMQDEFLARRHGREVVESDIGAIAWERYSKLIEKDERLRDRELTDDDFERLWDLIVKEVGEEDHEAWRVFEHIRTEPERYRAARAQLQAALTSGDAARVRKALAKAVDRELAARHAKLEPGSSIHRKVTNAVARADMEFLKRAAERDAMDWGGAPADPLVKRAERPKAAPPGSRIMDHYDRFLKQRASDISADTISQNKGVIQLFAEFVGEDLPVDQLRRKHVAEWRDQLYLMPKMAKQVTALKDLKFKQVIAANQKLGRPTIDPKTINRYLSALSPFAKWLAANDMVGNPIMVDDMFIKLDRSKPKRAPFSDEQLRTLFGSPLFRGCLSDTAEHKPGNFVIRDWRYWLPLIALFSGMRLGEIAQLLVDDVQEMHGTWVMHVTTEGDDTKKLKTVGSERIVPVHSDLIALGFLGYHKRVKEAGSKRLFPEIKADSRGFMSGMPSKFLNTYLDRIGVKTKTLTMHSFRHLFADRLRKAGYLDSEFGFILGHGDRLVRTTGRYGALPQGTVEHRKKLIEAVTFADLDLKALKKQSEAV